MKNKEDIIDYMYRELEELRHETGKSLTQFCQPINKGQNWYQQNLKSKRDIPFSDLVRLLESYGKTIRDVFDKQEV